MAFSSSSSSSSRQLKHHVFLSFRGEDTRHNFTSHLLESLKGKGLDVFFDEEKLEKGEQLSQALIKAIAASNISIIVLSVDYASSKSCLTELSEIMDRKGTQGQIVLPIFYHVNPSDVRNIGGSFKTSFGEHESKRPGDKVLKRWKEAFGEVGKLKGWHIEGGIFDRSEPAYIKEIGEYVIKRLNSKSRSVSEELFGIEEKKETILGLIEQEDSRVIGIWGMGGIGKTTLAEAVHTEVFQKFDDHYFLQNVREKIEKQGRESLRNELLSTLLKQEIRIDTPSIGSTLIQQRLNNKRVFVVLDDVDESDLIEFFGVKHFAHGSKTLVTSRDQQVLRNGGVVKAYEVQKLNEDESLQFFSKFAFKQLNPSADFRDLSNKFVKYAQGNPLALKVLGSNLYQRPRREWKSAVDKLQAYPETKITKVLHISYDGLDQLEKDIFLDIACFFNWESKENVEDILSCCYSGAVYAISNLIHKSLLDSDEYPVDKFPRRGPFVYISMHDLLQEMGRDIVQNEHRYPGKRKRLWRPKDVYNVLKYNKGTEAIEAIMLDMSKIDPLQLCPTVFENMFNLRFLMFHFPMTVDLEKCCSKFKGSHVDQVDAVSLPDELRFLWWDYYPFKSLSSNFNPKNLVELHLRYGNMEQLWNEDHKDLVNLRHIVLNNCKNLRKIPNLSRAINLERLDCYKCESLVELPCLSDLTNLRRIVLDNCKNLRKISNLFGAINLETFSCFECESLVELPCFNHMTSLRILQFSRCRKLKKFPEVPYNFSTLNLEGTEIEEVPDSIEHLLKLTELKMGNSRVKYVSSNVSKLESLYQLNLSHCPITKFPEIPRCLSKLDLSGTQIEEVPSSITRLKDLLDLKINHCKSLKILSELPPRLQYLDAHDCMSLEKVSFTNQYLYAREGVIAHDSLIFSNCSVLNQDSIGNIVANALLRMKSLAKLPAGKYEGEREKLFYCFPGKEISSNKFKTLSMNSSIVWKRGQNRRSGSRFLVFALYLVADLVHRHKYETIEFICEYQLKAISGDYEKFKSEWRWCKPDYKSETKYLGDHVLILFNCDMVKKDKDYEAASFEFYIRTPDYIGQKGTKVDDIKVEKFGVHVFYVDAESSAVIDVESSEKFKSDERGNDESDEDSDIYYDCEENFDSEEDANIEEVHDDSAAKMRSGHKRSLSCDGEGEGWPKRLK